jgi:glycosyltransferase involved in cell wall biosynthesis
MAKVLYDDGFNAIILHEKNDYVGVGSWLGQEYMELPHKSIDGQNLEISPEDFIIIPELYGFVMSQISNLPCGKIVLSQAYDHILETLQPGTTWAQVGFHKCITTSEFQKDYISNLMRGCSIDVIEPIISNKFTKSETPAKPIVAVHTREQRDTHNLIKNFYVKFPQYRWITFKDMRGLTESEFAETMKDCFLSVWIDDVSGYGTFPLESMKSGVPVLGYVPNLLPHWINEDNGLWVNNKLQIVDFIADFLQNWLEDNIDQKLFDEMDKTVTSLQSEEDFKNKVIDTFDEYVKIRLESFESQLTKLQETE